MQNKKKLILISSLVTIALIIIIYFITTGSEESFLSSKNIVDRNLLVGNWVRTDASYLIKINKVNDDGTLEAQYFNPKPINVGNANWEESYGNIKVIVKLQDENYPGSTYTLNYLSERDMLAGEYYQAVDRLTFYVEFVRDR